MMQDNTSQDKHTSLQSQSKDSQSYKIFLKSILGMFILVLGITCILLWWQDVISFFKSIIGMALSIGGLLVLYSIKK